MTQPEIDPVLTVGQQLLACLQVAAQAAPNPPGDANFIFLPGAQATADISAFDNLCCPGTGYVRMAQIYPSGANFPAPDTEANQLKCGPMGLALTFEMGMMRCSPTGNVNSIPTGADWSAAFTQQMIDATTMRKAVCTFRSLYATGSSPYVDGVLLGNWTPVGPEGGCLTGTQIVTIGFVGCPGC